MRLCLAPESCLRRVPGGKAFCNASVAKIMEVLLTFLGHRGRLAVAKALAAWPQREWNLRALAAAAAVHPVVAGRAVRELEALAAADVLRPGRDLVVRWRPQAPAAAFLAGLEVPDLHGMAADAFRATFRPPLGAMAVRWHHPEDVGPSPLRIAVLVRRDEEAALEAVGPALDAVRAAGLPAPHLTTVPHALLGDDPVSQAVRRGVPL